MAEKGINLYLHVQLLCSPYRMYCMDWLSYSASSPDGLCACLWVVAHTLRHSLSLPGLVATLRQLRAGAS